MFLSEETVFIYLPENQESEFVFSSPIKFNVKITL